MTSEMTSVKTVEETAVSFKAKMSEIENRKPLAGTEIAITDIEPLLIGQAENKDAATGCTVLVCKDGMRAGLDVRGGGPASRESQLLNPLMSAQMVHAIVLSGGSAYGLGTANGVMSYLEEQGIGYDTGCGASVGKIGGMDYAMKTGIGSYAVQIGDLKIGAIVVLNALGDVYDWRTGEQIAGFMTEDHKALRSTMEQMSSSIEAKDKFTGNTTLAVVVTNAKFDKAQLCKIAGMAHDGYARSINPVHTSADGDSIYAVSVGEVAADQDLVGALGAEVVSEAIIRAVYNSESAYGLPAAADLP